MFPQPRYKRRHQDQFYVTVRRDQEQPLRTCRIETLLMDHKIVDLCQGCLEGWRDLFGKLRWPYSVPFPDKQWIFQHVTQPVERIRQRGLCDAETAGGTRNASLFHEGQEHGEKVQIVFHLDIMPCEYLKSNK